VTLTLIINLTPTLTLPRVPELWFLAKNHQILLLDGRCIIGFRNSVMYRPSSYLKLCNFEPSKVRGEEEEIHLSHTKWKLKNMLARCWRTVWWSAHTVLTYFVYQMKIRFYIATTQAVFMRYMHHFLEIFVVQGASSLTLWTEDWPIGCFGRGQCSQQF